MLSLSPELFAELNARQWVGNMRLAVYGDDGMKAEKIAELQTHIGFSFPPDFVTLLQHLVDPGEVLFDYRNFSKIKYDKSIEWILDGLLWTFDNDRLWMKRWGPKPSAADDAKNLIRRDFASWPRLLPIYGHRYFAAEPSIAGNPVLSIMGTDIIYYGANLAHYLAHEFLDQNFEQHVGSQKVQQIPIWSDFAEHNRAAFDESYFNN